MITVTIKRILLTCSVFLCVTMSCSGPVDKTREPTAEEKQMTKSTGSPIDGAWELVWTKVNGKISTPAKPMQIKLFSDGFFSFIMQDSAGKWNNAIAGTFETNGNVYHETAVYSVIPEYVGYTDWQEFEIKGDTLYMKLFTKMLNAKGEDVTATMPKMEEKRVRAKR